MGTGAMKVFTRFEVMVVKYLGHSRTATMIGSPMWFS